MGGTAYPFPVSPTCGPCPAFWKGEMSLPKNQPNKAAHEIELPLPAFSSQRYENTMTVNRANGSLRSGRQYKAKRNKRIKTAEAKAFTPWPPLFVSTSEPHHHGKAAFEIIGVRPMSIWWRWRELNPCPKINSYELLRVQFIFSHSVC